eukprot:CAMPEP_0176429484 /NCGR_PEP_ID=MMETSP0127-20121128/13735_1 /TAXON_ID=938130 /ORGANISM="Platyophrya macrostoma, Strain WH" /LENGTH=631 /DNA_ID=CAMNT_0017811291 /DNA_START=1 /DNA_END=1896 /DNA_ORIENTATION=+
MKKKVGGYRVEEEISKSPLGSLYKAVHIDNETDKAIILTIDRGIIKEKYFEEFKENVTQLMLLEDECITKIKQMTYTKSHIYVFFDYPNNFTPLSAFIKKSRKPVNEKNLKKIFRHLLEFTDYLKKQEAQVNHLVPELIFYNSSYRIRAAPPIFDPLLHHKKLRSKYAKLCSQTSAIPIPSELEDGEVFQSKKSQSKALVWSFGQIMGSLTAKDAKVTTKSLEGIMKEEELSSDFKKLLKKMVAEDAENRISLKKLEEDSWFKKRVKKVTFDESTVGDKQRKWNEKEAHTKGKFTPQEMDTLKHSLCKYVQEKGLGFNGLIKLVTQKAEDDLRGAWTTIASCLPNRSVQSCYRQIRNKYHPDNYKGKWTPEEEHDLKELVKENGRKWELIGEKLGRTALNVRDKYKEIGEENSDQRVKGEWTPQETVKFIRLVEQNLGKKFLSDDIDGKIDEFAETHPQARVRTQRRRTSHGLSETMAFISDFLDVEAASKIDFQGINWTKIANTMQTRSKDDCRNKWFNQIFNTISTQLEYSRDEDKKLLEGILEQGVDKDEDIDFDIIDNGRKAKENQIRWKNLKKHVESRSIRSHAELIKQLKDQMKTVKMPAHARREQELGKDKNDLIELFNTSYSQ